MVAAAMSACSTKTNSSAIISDEPFDSLTIEVDSMAVSMTLRVYGSADDSLSKSLLAQYVNETLFFMEDENGNIIRPAYEGNLRAFLQTCAQQKWEEMKNDTFGTPDEEEADEDSDIPTVEELAEEAIRDSMSLSTYEINYTKAYETDSLVTWTSEYNFYIHATAHPSFGGTGLTFRKADGQILGHDMLKDTDSQAFRQLMKKGLRQWLKDVLEIDAATDQDLKEMLYGESFDPNALPMPEQRPFLTTEGVVLPYYENELTFSREPAMITIPYDKVKPYLK